MKKSYLFGPNSQVYNSFLGETISDDFRREMCHRPEEEAREQGDVTLRTPPPLRNQIPQTCFDVIENCSITQLIVFRFFAACSERSDGNRMSSSESLLTPDLSGQFKASGLYRIRARKDDRIAGRTPRSPVREPPLLMAISTLVARNSQARTILIRANLFARICSQKSPYFCRFKASSHELRLRPKSA